MTNQERAKKLTERIKAQVERAVGRGLNAARIFLTARIKETLNVPAPKVRLPDGSYRATTRATKGAPPRKVSGALQRSVQSRMEGKRRALFGATAKSRKGFLYGKALESDDHPFIRPTYKKYEKDVKRIVGGELKLSFRRSELGA